MNKGEIIYYRIENWFREYGFPAFIVIVIVIVLGSMIIRMKRNHDFLNSPERCREFGRIAELDTKVVNGTCYVYAPFVEGYISRADFEDYVDGSNDTTTIMPVPIIIR